jgi:hypothetical protein
LAIDAASRGEGEQGFLEGSDIVDTYYLDTLKSQRDRAAQDCRRTVLFSIGGNFA